MLVMQFLAPQEYLKLKRNMVKDNIQTLKKENNELKVFNVTFLLFFTFCTTYISLNNFC